MGGEKDSAFKNGDETKAVEMILASYRGLSTRSKKLLLEHPS